MSELSNWLKAHGLAGLRDVLEAQQIDLDILPDLTEEDFKHLGIALGPRRRLLKAIQAISATPAPLSRSGAEHLVDGAERRQLSVLFVDLVGSTSLSASRDPEEMRQIIRRYQNAVAGEIARFDGYVAKFMGDGVLGYFGWPKAHEDEAERAVRAALAAVAAVGELRTGGGAALAARAGIATGLVVVGDLVGEGAAQESAVVGDTPNIASRLQTLAEPGQVLIAESTQRLVHSTFDVAPLGSQSLKGLEVPVAIFAVDRERSGGSRFEARTGKHLRPMIGRDQELALLCERWSQAQSGEGQCLLLVGEAGIGKSRITRALLDSASGPDHIVLRYQCSPYHLDSALWPIIQQLAFAARLSPDDSPDDKLDKIEALLRAATDAIAEATPLIASLLGVPYQDRYGTLDLSPQMQRNRTLATLSEQLLALAQRKPVLVVIEDVHWIDPSTLEFVRLLLDQIEDTRVLVLLTSRPDGQPVLAAHPHVTRLALNRLGRAAVEAITAAIAGSDNLPAAVRREIAARTDGVPLFIEELTRALVELAEQSQAGSVGREHPEANLAVPATLHDSLMSRLDRLPEVKRVAQVAACIGRNFDYRTLAAVANIDEEDLHAGLDRLVDNELIFRRGVPPDASYTFKHALVRDAAANSLLRSEFRRINAAIVAAFEAAEPPPPPELIGWHAELGSLDRKAIDYLLRAGGDASARYANQEAINHIDRALRLIAGLPDGPERSKLELAALTIVGVPRIALFGYAAAEVEATYRRTVELVERVGDKVQLFQGLRGLWNCIYDRADLHNARDIAERLCALAAEQPGPEARGLGYRALGAACFSLGRFADSIDAFEKCAAAGAALPPDAGLREHGESPWIIGGVYAGFAHAVAGNFDRAQSFIDEALAAAQRLDHPLTFAFAHHIAANVRYFTGEAAECARLIAESLRVSEEHRLVFWSAGGDIMGGWATVRLSGETTGIERTRRGLHAWQANGAELHIPTWQSVLADGLIAIGAIDEADEIVEQAMALAQSRDEMFAVSVLWRLKGLVAERQGDLRAAEAHFARAVAIADTQGARLFELRAACDLARSVARRGDRVTARQTLAGSYGKIREGSVVACMVEARDLLASLT
jgi:class 3 adenylate cyclase/tetratricopeptide (TPR) repeat protein/type II secretory pathway predicted ATPase ExeA